MATPVGLQVDFSSIHDSTLWETMVGYRPAVADQMVRFINQLPIVTSQPEEFSLDFLVGSGIAACRNYLLRAYLHRRSFLDIAAQIRYHLTSPDTADQSYEARTARFWEQARRTLSAQSEIESFYFTLKLLLDRLATVFRFYFMVVVDTKERGSAHRGLESAIRKRKKPVTSIVDLLPGNFLASMEELSDRIIDFRNTEIEHVSEPQGGVSPGIWWEDATDQNSVPRMIAMRIDATYKMTDDPAALHNLVEAYIGISLDFMAAHPDKSVFTTRPPAT